MEALSFTALILALSVAFIFSAFRWNQERAQKEYDFQLFPNCLITRHPLVFVHGLQSPLYFSFYWNFVPEFLREHGYEVIELSLPWRGHLARTNELQNFLEVLESENLPCHFFFDESSKELAKLLMKTSSPWAKSVTVMDPNDFADLPRVPRPWTRILHDLFFMKGLNLDPRSIGLVPAELIKPIGRVFLSKCVHLAEDDFQHGATADGINRGNQQAEL